MEKPFHHTFQEGREKSNKKKKSKIKDIILLSYIKGLPQHLSCLYDKENKRGGREALLCIFFFFLIKQYRDLQFQLMSKL